MKIIWVILVLSLLFLFTGCSENSNIKNDFCGVHINFQYCKCAFHDEYCANIGMSKSEANTYVYAEYNKWLDSLKPEKTDDEEKYGIIEKDGNLYLNSKPGEVLKIKTEDLPKWAQGQIATVGATILVVGPPDSIAEGDNNVLLDGLPIARINDSTAHGGIIVEGSDKIFVNNRPVAIIGGFAVDPMISPGATPHVGGPIATNN